MFKGRKRKQKDRQPHAKHFNNDESNEPDPVLFIQAHEADIIRGPQAWSAASDLDAEHAGSLGHNIKGLIRWNVLDTPAFEETERTGDSDENVIWVDRYDARLLLDPTSIAPAPAKQSTELFSDGWSDLPSDTEDTFFFSRDETEDYHREKRRRMIDQEREERLRALQDADGEEETREEDEWGGSDEEPDNAQKELMRRTAIHVVASPNAAQLEMRILANHGADQRFAFLRGRWSRAWKLAKGHARLDSQREQAETSSQERQKTVLDGLTGYGDSDSDSDPGHEDSPSNVQEDNAVIPGEAEHIENTEATSAVADSGTPVEDAAKAARRARAREWAAKRRADAVEQEAKTES